jgi:hypothetical protein
LKGSDHLEDLNVGRRIILFNLKSRAGGNRVDSFVSHPVVGNGEKGKLTFGFHKSGEFLD